MLAFKIFLGVLGAGFIGAIAWCYALIDKQNKLLTDVERRLELYEHLQDKYCAKITKNELQLSSLADTTGVLTNRLNLLYDDVHERADTMEHCIDYLHNKLTEQQGSFDYIYKVCDMFDKEQLALEEKIDQTTLDIQDEFRANDKAFHNRLTRVEDKLGMVQCVDLEDEEGRSEEGFEECMEDEKVSSKQGTDGDFEGEKAPESTE